MEETRITSSDGEHGRPDAGLPDADEGRSTRSASAEASLQLPQRLRYSCTHEEREEARELEFVESYGGGSKWKAVGFLAIAVGVGFVSLVLRVGPAHRLLLIVAVVAVAALFIVYERLFGQGAEDAPVDLEVGEDGLRILSDGSRSTISASSFETLFESERLFALKTGAILILLPKRVFESEQQRAGFRALATRWTEAESPAAVREEEAAETPADVLSVEFRLKFRDYVDRTLASWLPRSLCIGFLMLFLGTFVYACLEPVPGAVYSNAEVFLYFVLPASFFLVLFLFTALCVYTWLNERPHLCNTRVTLGNHGIGQATATHDSLLTWSEAARFKESLRAFYIWRPGTPSWTMIPKRAFASAAEIQRCRSLLELNAEESTWFWS